MPERYAGAEDLILSLLGGHKEPPPEAKTDAERGQWLAKRFAITKSLLVYALNNFPQLAIISMADILARTNAPAPKKNRGSQVVLDVPDEVVADLRETDDEDRDLYLLVHIPNQILRRQQSRIVLPGEKES